MKTLFLSLFLLTVLPGIANVNSSVYMIGEGVVAPGETAVFVAYPDDSSYSYVWSFDRDIEKVENIFSISISGNSIAITPLNGIEYALLDVYCDIYDANGSYIGTASAGIVVQP